MTTGRINQIATLGCVYVAAGASLRALSLARAGAPGRAGRPRPTGRPRLCANPGAAGRAPHALSDLAKRRVVRCGASSGPSAAAVS